MLKIALVCVFAVCAATVLAFPHEDAAEEVPPKASANVDAKATPKPFDTAIQECFSEDSGAKTFTNSSDPCILKCAAVKAGLATKEGELDPEKFIAYLKKYEPVSHNTTAEYVKPCWRDCKDDSNEKCANYRHFFVCLRIRPLIPVVPNVANVTTSTTTTTEPAPPAPSK